MQEYLECLREAEKKIKMAMIGHSNYVKSAVGGAVCRAVTETVMIKQSMSWVKDGVDEVVGRAIDSHIATAQSVLTSALSDIEIGLSHTETEALGELRSAIDDIISLFDDRKYNIHLKSDVSVRAAVWLKTNGMCVYCDTMVDHPNVSGAQVMHVDHFIPVSGGGPDNLGNYVPACQSCNSAKSNRDPVEFIMSLRNQRQNVVPIATKRMTGEA